MSLSPFSVSPWPRGPWTCAPIVLVPVPPGRRALQWTGSGRPGRPGAAAVSRVGAALSGGSASARGLSSGEQPARARRRSSASAAPSGVPVSVTLGLPPGSGPAEGPGGLGAELAGGRLLLVTVDVPEGSWPLAPAASSHLPFRNPAPAHCVWTPTEPHEICDEDNFGTVIWKETPAGEVAAVRCPRNATGEGLQAAGVGGPVLGQ